MEPELVMMYRHDMTTGSIFERITPYWLWADARCETATCFQN